MSVLSEFYRSTVGKKICMAVSGLVLVGFVIGHMAGNLKMFVPMHGDGVYKMDLYAEFLRSMGSDLFGHSGLLWIARVGLLAALVLHVVSAIQLSIINKRAKPVSNTNPSYGSSTAASRTMLYGGLFLLCFIVYHILHFTLGTVHYRGFQEGRVYANVWTGFQSMPVVTFYVVAMGFLALHLFHGTWSMFQTLGVDTPVWNTTLRRIAGLVSIVLFIGFTSVPVAVTLGLLNPPLGQSAVQTSRATSTAH